MNMPSHTPPRGINRRHALQLLGAGGLALHSSLSAGTATPTPPWKSAVGLNGFQSGTSKYHKTYPIWEVLDFAESTGFDGIELVANWPQGGYPDSDETDRIQALRGLYDRYHLQIFSIQLGADGAFQPDPTTRRDWIQSTRNRLTLARQLGCACVGFWPYGSLGNQSVDQALRLLADSFRTIADLAAHYGIVTAFEIEPPFAFHTEDHLREILARTNHPNLKVIYDPSHFDLMNGSTGKPHEMLERVGVSHIGYVHLTDTDGTLRDGGTSKHLPCGDGHVDIPASLASLHQGGFRGWIMIDSWEVPNPYRACRQGLNAIQSFTP